MSAHSRQPWLFDFTPVGAGFVFLMTAILLSGYASAQAVDRGTAISPSHLCYGQGGTFIHCGASGPYISGSNVGIAMTTSPTYALEVSGTLRIGNGGEACASGRSGALRYYSGNMQYCDGTNWKPMIQAQPSSPPTAPAGAGYFVLTHDSWNGNLGGYSGANSKCLSDLTTYTTWHGYSDANSRGLLNASKVGAFLCMENNYVACPTHLTASTSYYYSNNQSGMGGAGGGYFTTNASSFGPNDSISWASPNRFGGTFYYWNGNRTWSWSLDSSIFWWDIALGNTTCSVMSSSSSGDSAVIGATESAKGRWEYAVETCDKTHPLICYVNP